MKKNDFLAMIKELNDLEIIQKEYDFEENLPDEVFDRFFRNAEYGALQHGIDMDEHRWYEVSTTVYVYCKCFLLGVRTVTKLYSESSDIEDYYHTITFHEMKEVPTVTYVKA